MLKKLRRKIYRKIRFQTWYRKANYYHCKRHDLNKTIAQYRGVDVLSNKKRLHRLRRDMIRSLFRYGSYYNEYFLFGYEGKDAAYRDGFITEGVRMSYYPRMNDPKNTNLLENKYLTYQKFRDFYGRDVLRIKKGAQPTPAALEALRDFTQAHPDYIVKPIYAAFGKGVHTESIRNYPYLEAAHAAYSAHGAILEQIIEQGEALSRIHPQSVNTLRIPTVVLADGEVRLFPHAARRPRRGHHRQLQRRRHQRAHRSRDRVHLLQRRGQKGPSLHHASGHWRALSRLSPPGVGQGRGHGQNGRKNGARQPLLRLGSCLQHARLVHGRGQLHRTDGRHADHHTDRQKG